MATIKEDSTECTTIKHDYQKVSKLSVRYLSLILRARYIQAKKF